MPRRPHVLMIVVDSLRADVIRGERPSPAWDGIGQPEVPSLERLAGTSTRFLNAYACSSWTRPCVPSLLLSLYPTEHGIFEVEKTASGGAAILRLPSDVPTLAEILQFEGYRTIGLAPNAQLDPSLGFARGFHHFATDSMSGSVIAERFLSLAGARGDEPVFGYLHFLEPHWPYGRRIAARAETLAAGRRPFHRFRGDDWKALKEELKRGEAVLSGGDVEFMRRLYALAVEEADAAIGELLEGLRANGMLDGSVVLLTADHGEELMDHGSIGHGHALHEELIHVPLWLRLPGGGAAAGGMRHELVSHVDVMPTIIEAAGVTPASHASGRSLLAGPDPDPRAVFAEVKHKRRYRRAIRRGGTKLIQQFVFERDKLATTEDYNNLDELMSGRPARVSRELYDIPLDPGERTDLAVPGDPGRPSASDALEAELETWWRNLRRASRGELQQLEGDIVKQFRSLGYL